MPVLMQAHPFSFIVIFCAMMVTPVYIFATYAHSQASLQKASLISAGFLLWGGVMGYICLFMIPVKLAPFGALVVPLCWFSPLLILYFGQNWFLDKPLSQHWLIGLQLWRLIGGLFLVEMARGYIPGIFAYPAGLGDMSVAILAACVLFLYWKKDTIPKGAIYLVIICGALDFASAFFFAVTSSRSPVQLFFPEGLNQTMMFPTGMIPLFLVPYAIFFHGLSWLNFKRFG